MSTLYWIHVLGALFVIGVVMLIIAAIMFIITVVLISANVDYYKNNEQEYKKMKKASKYSLGALICSVIIVTFAPSYDELYVIYGVGPIIDYVKDSKDAKEVPDKVIKALNVYLDNQIDKKIEIKPVETDITIPAEDTLNFTKALQDSLMSTSFMK